ncbi:S8 family peptidase [Nocardioides sp. R1-1]|uniref:S8 family peptidase n=1 Tax=Nocardioides sp. R1-1 TaxID=3383502 RepID=UPI0038D11B08
MSKPGSSSSSPGWLSSIVDQWRHRLRRWRPKPQRVEEPRERLRVQTEIIRRAFDGAVSSAGADGGLTRDDADTAYLFRPDHLLVRADSIDAVADYLASRPDTYQGELERVAQPTEGLVLTRLPVRRDHGDPVLSTLDDLDRAFPRDAGGSPVASPDHIVYVTYPRMCPATEPEEPKSRRPWPPPATRAGRVPRSGQVRVAVVDTGLWTDAVGSPHSPWLTVGDVVADPSDVETVDSSAIHAYAGHGTFVAGVISCLAPGTRIEVEGVLVHGGAVYESEIVQQLQEAIDDDDRPQVISISAGTHTRGDFAPLGFELLGESNKLGAREDVLIVAAAGNDASDKPFWPAAFDWVVSVGSVDPDAGVSDFSNVGPWVDVYARGRDVVNAFPKGTYTCYEPPHVGEVRTFDGLARWSGTSFSTPVVTGLIAARMRETGQSAREAWRDVLAGATAASDPRGGAIRIVGPLT